MPGTGLSAEDTVGNKAGKYPASGGNLDLVLPASVLQPQHY